MLDLPKRTSFLFTARTPATALAMLVCAVSVGCGSTRIEHSWTSPEFRGAAFRKVLVIGMASRAEVRRMYEDAFVRQLEGAGAGGVASYTMLPDAQRADKAAIAKAVAESGADAVLVTRLVKREKETVADAPEIRVQEYIDTAWPGTYTPVGAQDIDVVTLETRLFDAKGDRLVWSGTTKTFDAAKLQRDVEDVARKITKELARRKVV